MKLLAILKVPSDIVDIVSLHRFKKQVSEPIASSLGKFVCLDKNVALSHKIGPILSLHRCRKIFIWFFLSLHRWQKFWPTKLYRFIRFFSQKLCICIALNDTFLSIAAHHCLLLCSWRLPYATPFPAPFLWKKRLRTHRQCSGVGPCMSSSELLYLLLCSWR